MRIALASLFLAGCAAIAPTKREQMQSVAPVGLNHPCTFGGVDDESRVHCIQITYGLSEVEAVRMAMTADAGCDPLVSGLEVVEDRELVRQCSRIKAEIDSKLPKGG